MDLKRSAVRKEGGTPVEDGVEGGGGVADVDALPVEVEAERFSLAVAEGQGGGGLGRVGKPVQLGQPDRAVAGLDVTEHPAGTDRGELLIITDQSHTAAAVHDEADRGIQGERVGHPGLVDDHKSGSADALRPIRYVSVVDGPSELRQCLGRRAGGITQLRSRSSGRRKPEYVAAAIPLRLNQRAHSGGLPGSGRRDCQLQPRP